MTKEDIVKLAVDNHLVLEVYDALHSIVMVNISYLRDKNAELSAERKLVKKFANVNKLNVIKDILKEDE